LPFCFNQTEFIFKIRKNSANFPEFPQAGPGQGWTPGSIPGIQPCMKACIFYPVTAGVVVKTSYFGRLKTGKIAAP
jgi:hypothetical protein